MKVCELLKSVDFDELLDELLRDDWGLLPPPDFDGVPDEWHDIVADGYTSAYNAIVFAADDDFDAACRFVWAGPSFQQDGSTEAVIILPDSDFHMEFSSVAWHDIANLPLHSYCEKAFDKMNLATGIMRSLCRHGFSEEDVKQSLESFDEMLCEMASERTYDANDDAVFITMEELDRKMEERLGIDLTSDVAKKSRKNAARQSCMMMLLRRYEMLDAIKRDINGWTKVGLAEDMRRVLDGIA